MKRILFHGKGAWILGLVLLVACSKVNNSKMAVVRDCTGTYLRFEGKDYMVCNISSMAGYPDGAIVRASFRKIRSCDEGPEAVCMMLHENEGWVKVTDIE